ncbi:ammonium transporter [Methylonatrum kenyense]|uniref:ammonium transporter n=1 Tax=Methylonatrum kenyense TaxID=455253 RepID=UPI0020C0F312|nr:ammonium transporter [Methylonatrum kenyense]MCK8516334.1 ammonium transporter [Methylonatrum kenyense]
MKQSIINRLMLLVLLACLAGLFAPSVMAEYATPTGMEGLTADTTHLQDEIHKYHKSMDVWFMLMLVAFLMLFIKKFEWGVCLATMLVTAGSFITHTAIQQFGFGASWSQDLVILSVFCSITVVLAIGVFLGTIKMWQYFLAGILFAPAWVAIDWFMFGYLEGVVDPGGSMLVHMVAAYWGWGVILALREKRAFNEPMETTTHSVSFVWLASMLLFVLWPSFVTALLPADMVNWGMFTAYMAGLGSVISAYFTCVWIQKKVDPLVYTYALLAGMVAIGSPLVSVDPWTAFGIGLVAGAASVWSFLKLHDWLAKKTGVLDVMGVQNLHGVPGIIGGLAGAIFAAGMVNVISVVGVFILSLFFGAITGLILKATRGLMDESEMFSDQADFLGSNSGSAIADDRAAAAPAAK